jgi:3-deoxy-D-manno-octulosonate 8-phosphate phosphatase (KDO 8-P phosphatase)
MSAIFEEKLKDIKLVLTDVDGVLTKGEISYNSLGQEIKNFNVKDGFIVSFLQNEGIEIGFITGRSSDVVTLRARELKISFIFQGIKDKLKVADNLRQQLNLDWSQIAYLGDDWNDLDLLQEVGFSAIPVDAADGLASHVNFVSTKRGGEAFFREVCEMIMKSKDLWPPKSYN